MLFLLLHINNVCVWTYSQWFSIPRGICNTAAVFIRSCNNYSENLRHSAHFRRQTDLRKRFLQFCRHHHRRVQRSLLRQRRTVRGWKVRDFLHKLLGWNCPASVSWFLFFRLDLEHYVGSSVYSHRQWVNNRQSSREWPNSCITPNTSHL